MQTPVIYFRGQLIGLSPPSNQTYVETLYMLRQVFKCMNLNTKHVPLKLDYFLWIEPETKKNPRKLLVTQKKLFHAASQSLHLRQTISQDQF